jgi:hypothetical protein
MSDRYQRLRVSLVRRGVVAAGLAACLALPLGLALLGSDPPGQGPSAPDPSAGLPPRASASSAPNDARSLPPAARAERERIARLRKLPREELIALVREGADPERLVAVNVLWARGEHETVISLTANSGSRVLAAKLEALRGRTH